MPSTPFIPVPSVVHLLLATVSSVFTEVLLGIFCMTLQIQTSSCVSLMSRGSSLGIVARYELDDRGIVTPIPGNDNGKRQWRAQEFCSWGGFNKFS